MAKPLLEIVRIGRVQEQPDIAFFPCPPAFRCTLPAEIPDAHPLSPQAANVLRIECALGSPVEDKIGVQKDTGGSEVVVAPAHLAGRYSRATKAVPRSVRARQHDAHLLGAWIAVDDDNELGTVNRLAPSSNCILRSD